MIKPKSSKAAVLALTLTAVLLTLTSYGAVTVYQNIGAAGTISVGAGIGVYSDSGCTNEISSINWGSLEPGQNVNRVVYVKNTGDVTLDLAMSTNSWNPSGAGTYLSVSWDRQGYDLQPGQSVAATLTLSVSSSITNIQSFSVQINISGTG